MKVIEAMYYIPEFQPITQPSEITQDAIQVVNFTNQGFKVEVEAETWPEQEFVNEQPGDSGKGCPAMASPVFNRGKT